MHGGEGLDLVPRQRPAVHPQVGGTGPRRGRKQISKGTSYSFVYLCLCSGGAIARVVALFYSPLIMGYDRIDDPRLLTHAFNHPIDF